MNVLSTEPRIKHRLDPERYEREAFANLGGVTASELEISAIVQQLDRSMRESLLEIGVGPGRILEKLIDLGLHVVGIDYDPKMVHHAAARTKQHQGIDLVVADGQNLPFKSSAFDAVVCVRVLKYFLLPQRGLKEMCSVLKPKGVLVLEFPNLISLSGLLQMYQLFTMHEFYPRLFKKSTIEGFMTKNRVRVEAEHGLYKIPPKLWTLTKKKTVVEFLILLERILQRVTPMELMSKSILLQGRKT